MRDQSSSFDVARMVTELRSMLGARARKAYQPHYEQVVLRLNQKG
jgi:predicted ribosome quality control (RQC) complex YloA/Tae2 family protein